MNQEKVSIIIPVYNAEKYLPGCIQSVIDQTYPSWELILVNDGSTDGSEQICRDFARRDQRIMVVTQENRGVSGARNAGMCCATGRWVSFMDSDDALEANAIELLLRNMIECKADISSATKCSVAVNGDIRAFQNEEKRDICEGEEMIRRSLSYDKESRSVVAKLFARDFIKDIRFIEGRNINEDGYFLFQCYAKKPRVVQQNVSIYKYYCRENSASNGKFSEKYLDMLYFSELKMQYIQKNMPHLLDEAKNMEARTHLLFLQVLCRTADKKYKSVQKKSVETVRSLYRYYRPINGHHKKLAWMVVHGLYPVYRAAIRFKFYR